MSAGGWDGLDVSPARTAISASTAFWEISGPFLELDDITAEENVQLAKNCFF